MFRDLVETVRRDITGALPDIIKQGKDTIQDIKHSGNYSRRKLRKWGILSNPYKKKKPGWKPSR